MSRLLTVASAIDVSARFGRAPADPIRCRILLWLRQAPAYPADLADQFGISRTLLSNHLACLHDCGLVVTVPDGQRTRYELTDERLGHALDDPRAAVVAVGQDLPRRGQARLLVTATIIYNVIEAVAALTAGTIASSTALIGFAVDSVIEVSSAAAVAWHFSARDHAVREAREHATLRIIAVSFFLLAAYVATDAVRALTGTGEAERALPGMVLAALSLAVMPFLSAAQRRAGRELGSASAIADSKQTRLRTYLSAALLAGLDLNAALGWLWADPLAALAIADLAVKEGRNA